MLKTNTNNSNTFIYVIDGTISMKAPEGEGKQRENKNGDKVWEHQFDAVTGTIKNFSIQESKVGEQLVINITDVDEKYAFQLPIESSYFSSFANKIGNVDLTKPVEIKTYSFIPKDKDKKISGLNFYQAGEKVLPSITREVKPEGYPEPEGDTSKYDKDDWKVYFITKTKWEKKYLSSFEFKTVTPEQVAEGLKADFDANDIGNKEVPF